MKLGAARSRASTAWCLVDIEMGKESPMFIYRLSRQKLRTDTPILRDVKALLDELVLLCHKVTPLSRRLAGSAARASQQPPDKSDYEAPSKRRNRVRNMSFGTRRWRPRIGDGREWQPSRLGLHLLRGKNSPVRRSGSHKPQCTG